MFFNESLKGFLLQKKKKQQLKDSFVESEPEDAGLCQLLDRIFQTNTKLTDQMVLPNHQLQKKLDMAAVYAAVDKMNNRRLNNQDWMSSSDHLESNIIEWIIHTQSDQRFELSPEKEFDLFLCQLFAKLDRQMTDQDAPLLKQ